MISNMTAVPWEKLVEEADKCVLLCSNCHRIIHANNEVKYFDNTHSRHRDRRSNSDQGSLFSDSELPRTSGHSRLRGSPELPTTEGWVGEARESGSDSVAQRSGVRLSNTDEDLS